MPSKIFHSELYHSTCPRIWWHHWEESIKKLDKSIIVKWNRTTCRSIWQHHRDVEWNTLLVKLRRQWICQRANAREGLTRRRKGVRYRFESFPEDKLRKRSDTDTQQTTFETFPQALIKERHLIKKRTTKISNTRAHVSGRGRREGKRLKMTPKRGHRHKQWISQGTRKEELGIGRGDQIL